MQVFMCILNIPGAIFSGGEMDLDPGETTKKTNQIDVGNQHQSPIFVSISSTQIPVVIAWNKHSTGYWTCHHPKLVIRDSHHSRDRSRPVCFCLLILTFVSTCFHQAKNVWISPDRPTLKSLLSFRPCSTCRAKNGHRKSQRRGQVIGRIDRSSGFFGPIAKMDEDGPFIDDQHDDW